MPSAHFCRLTFSAALLGGALSLGAPAARAGDEPSPAELAAARQLFMQAERDEDAGRWHDALDKLLQVAQVKRTAGVRYHIALCEERLGALADALEEYTGSQSQAAVEHAKDVERLVGPALADLDPRVPRLAIHMVPDSPEATVMLDGSLLDRSKLGEALALNPGVHRIDATAPGRTTVRTTVTLRERESTVFDVALAELAPPVPPPPPPPVTPRHDPLSTSRTAAVATTVGALGLAGFGGVSFVAAGAVRAAAVRRCSGETDAASCDGSKNAVRAWDWAALVAWGAAAITGSTAVVLWTHPADRMSSSGRIVIGPGSVGVAGSF
jgi:hypothetical protein